MAKPSRTLKVYKSYNFVNKDPVIDIIRTVVEDSSKPYARIERDSGVTSATLRNWFYGKTRRPQFATIAAVARACGEQITIGGRRVHPLRVVTSAVAKKASR